MYQILGAVTTATTLLLIFCGTARSQSAYLGFSGGVLLVDDGGVADLEEFSTGSTSIFGGEFGFLISPRWEVSAAIGFAPREKKFETTEIDILVYYGTVTRVFRNESDMRFFLSGGAGGIKLDTGGFLSNIPSNQDLLLNFGGGIRWLAHDRISLQAIFRDHLHFCQALGKDVEVSYCPLDDQFLHHLEASGGILILF